MAIRIGQKIPEPKFELIPDELKSLNNWLLWIAKPIKHKPEEATKVPVTIDGNPFNGWNNLKNLYSFNEVKQAYLTGNFDGIGFVLAGTDLICIDLDNNISTDNISEELLELLRYGYTEISPSGKGYHIWVKGEKPPGMGRNGYTTDGDKLEVFGGSGWVTVTGDIDWAVSSLGPIREKQPFINNLYKSYFKPKQNNGKSLNPTKPNKDNFDLGKVKFEMFNAPNGQKIERLWNGDTSLHRGDHSSADLALCGYLVQYTKGDYQKVDTLFRQSGLYRKKWDEKRGYTTYGGLTINKALENSEFYNMESQSISVLFENMNFEVDLSKGNNDEQPKQSIGDIVDTVETDIRSNIEEKIELILEKINSQVEFNQSMVEKLDSYNIDEYKRFSNTLETQNTQIQFMNDIQKQLQQIIAYQVNHNNRSLDNYKLIFSRVIEITERQERLDEFNKKLLRRIEKQQEYINETLVQNNLQVTVALKEILEVKKDYKEILTNVQQEIQTVKKGFFKRLFNS